MQQRVPQLDAVRGLAVLLVILSHAADKYPALHLQQPFSKGWMGVDLFFVLSGFLITGILLDTRRSEGYFKNFYARRCLRIWPLYYSVLLLMFVIVPLARPSEAATIFEPRSSPSASQDVWWYLTYTSNLLIAWKHDWRHGVLGVTWSLAIEEQYYLVWAIVVYLTSLRTLKRLCVAMILLAPLLRFALLLSGWTWIQIYVFTLCRIDALAWGSVLAVISRQPWHERRRFETWFYRTLLLTGLPLLMCIVGGGWQYDHPITFTAGYSLVGLCFAALLSVVVSGEHLLWIRSVFETPVMVFFGKYSYALYLFHLPIRAAIRDIWFSKVFLYSSGAKAVFWQFIFFGVATLACIPPVLASWNLFEKYFLKLKKQFS